MGLPVWGVEPVTLYASYFQAQSSLSSCLVIVCVSMGLCDCAVYLCFSHEVFIKTNLKKSVTLLS